MDYSHDPVADQVIDEAVEEIRQEDPTYEPAMPTLEEVYEADKPIETPAPTDAPEQFTKDTSYSPPANQGVGDTVNFEKYGVKGTITNGGFGDGKTSFVTIDMDGDGVRDFYYKNIGQYAPKVAEELARKYDLPTTDIALIKMDTNGDGQLDEVRIELDGVDSGYRMKYGPNTQLDMYLAALKNPEEGREFGIILN